MREFIDLGTELRDGFLDLGLLRLRRLNVLLQCLNQHGHHISVVEREEAVLVGNDHFGQDTLHLLSNQSNNFPSARESQRGRGAVDVVLPLVLLATQLCHNVESICDVFNVRLETDIGEVDEGLSANHAMNVEIRIDHVRELSVANQVTTVRRRSSSSRRRRGCERR